MFNWLTQWLNTIDRTVDVPVVYGSLTTGRFHYLALIVLFVCAWIAYGLFRYAPSHRLMRFIGVLGVLGLAGELFRQLVILAQNNGVFDWSQIPYAFYVTGIISALLLWRFKDGAIGRSLQSYLGSFVLCGALIVIIRPEPFYGTSLILNILTVSHHGIGLMMGTALIANRRQAVYRWFLAGAVWMMLFTAIGYGLDRLLQTRIGLDPYEVFFITPPAKGIVSAWLTLMQSTLSFSTYTLLYYAIFVVAAFVMLNFAVYIMDRMAWEKA